eukprot:140981-Alexandrium_andersonii.AAC.1
MPPWRMVWRRRRQRMPRRPSPRPSPRRRRRKGGGRSRATAPARESLRRDRAGAKPGASSHRSSPWLRLSVGKRGPEGLWASPTTSALRRCVHCEFGSQDSTRLHQQSCDS